MKKFPRNPAWRRFRANRRGWWSLWIFCGIYALSLCAGFFCHDPHEVFPTSVLDPHLRPAAHPAKRYPAAAVEYAATDDGAAVSRIRAWGDTDRFADALASPLPPEPVLRAVRERLGGGAAPVAGEAFEWTDGAVSWRVPRSRETAAAMRVRVILRPADWRTAAPEPAERTAGHGEVALEPAAFPFRPVPGHPFGFDAAGRDVLSRVVYGARTAISFGLLLVAASLALGTLLGAVQGYFARWVDILGQRFTEIWSAIPFLYAMIFLGNTFGRSFGLLLAVYAAFNWIGVAAWVRAEFLRLRGRPFADAARVQGLSHAAVMFRHVLPNALAPLVTAFPFQLVGAIGALAALDYLGFGLPDGAPSWGELLREAQAFRQAWWLVLWPSVALFTVMLLGVFVGEGLRDAFDPRPAFSAAPVGRRKARVAAPPRTAGAPAPDSKPAALEIDDLRVSFDTPAGEVRAVDGVSLRVAPGEALGLVGESGCGKSVTALSVLRLVPSPPGRMVSGRVLVAGRDVASLSDAELRALRGGAVGMVFQDPMTSLSPLRRVGDQMLEALRLHRRVSRREGLALAERMLARCGIADPRRCLRQWPFRLSGGMQQRVMVATAMICGPRLLLADEPTTALDASVRAMTLDAMKSACGPETALLLVSHDMAAVRRCCSRVAVMYAGRIVESGPVDEVLRLPRHPYTAALLAAHPSLHPPGAALPAIPGSVPSPLDWPAGCRFAPRCSRATAECRGGGSPELRPCADGVACACLHPLDPGLDAGNSIRDERPAAGTAASAVSATEAGTTSGGSGCAPAAAQACPAPLAAVGVSKRFGRFTAVSNVSLSLRGGEILAVVGESGSGKTTLLRVLAGLEEPDCGEILLDGRAVGARRPRAQRRAVQVVFQDPFSALNPRRTIGSALTEAAVAHGLVARRDAAAFARDWLARVSLPPEAAERFPHELSGGQLQRVCIARALALRPRVLLLDEPVSALDVSVQAQILNLLSDVKRAERPAMLFVTHDLGVARSLADSVMVMHRGEAVECADAATLFAAPAHPYTRSLLSSEMTIRG